MRRRCRPRLSKQLELVIGPERPILVPPQSRRELVKALAQLVVEAAHGLVDEGGERDERQDHC